MESENLKLNNLINTIRKLRSTNGCPWDKKQTPNSLRKYLEEEVNELQEAIMKSDSENVCEEIGDVLYILLMLSEIYSEDDIFSLTSVVDGINSKLIRRHPHVFEDKKISDETELRLQWERIKQEEKSNN